MNLTLNTPNLLITLLKPEHLTLLVNYQNENRLYLAKWEPKRAEAYFSLEETKKQINKSVQQFKLGTGVSFVSWNRSKTKIIGLCTFSDIVYSTSLSCYIGYSLSERAGARKRSHV